MGAPAAGVAAGLLLGACASSHGTTGAGTTTPAAGGGGVGVTASVPGASAVSTAAPASSGSHGSTGSVHASTGAHGSSGSAPPSHASSGSHGSTGSAAPSSGSSHTAVAPGPPPGSNAAALQALLREAVAASHATYVAQYKEVGSTATITFAQMGARSAFLDPPSAYYTDGTTNTACDSSSAPPLCYTDARPLTGTLSLISPVHVSSAILAVAAQPSSVVHTSETHGGLASSCVAYSLQGQRVKYCLDDQGIVTYIRMPRAAFGLVSFSTTISAAEVSVPAGASTRPSPS